MSPDIPYNDQRRLFSWSRIVITPEQRSARRVCSIYLEGAPRRRGNFTVFLPPSQCASSCGNGHGSSGARHASLPRRLVNRNNCVQKLRGTLIVTWQANRIDTPPSRRAASSPAFVRSRRLLSDFSPACIRPARNTYRRARARARLASRSCGICGRMHEARNELPRLVNYGAFAPDRQQCAAWFINRGMRDN